MKSFTIDEGEVVKKKKEKKKSVFPHSCLCVKPYARHAKNLRLNSLSFWEIYQTTNPGQVRVSVCQCAYLEFSSSWALAVSFRLHTHRVKLVVALKRLQPAAGKETQFTAAHAAVRCLVFKRGI